MSSCSGDDLLKVFGSLNIDLRNLNTNVIKAWFDTDCTHTKDLLNWMCYLSEKNYVSPLEKSEYSEIEQVVNDEQSCIEELIKLQPEYENLLDIENNLEDILLLESELECLENESTLLDKLIHNYEDVISKVSTDITDLTSKEIQSKVSCLKAQELCFALSKELDGIYTNIQEQLVKYDLDSHFVNYIDVMAYHENIDSIKSGLLPLMELDRTYLENSDESVNDALEIARRRLLYSNQIHVVNNIEISKLKAILDFLNKTNITHIQESCPTQLNSEAKEALKKHLCEKLEDIYVKRADCFIAQAKMKYLEVDLEDYQSKLLNTSKILDFITKFLSYYAVTNVMEITEKKSIDHINTFFVKTLDFINGDLSNCRYRIDEMNRVIEKFNVYKSKPEFEKMKLASSVARVLSNDCYDAKSALETVCKFKAELYSLERNFFSNDFYEDRKKILQRKTATSILDNFLKCGPTDKIILVPVGLQNICFEIEEHLKREGLSVAQAVQIPKIAMKNATKAQNYIRQLWMNFLSRPSEVEAIIKQVQAEFELKTAQHFA